MANTDKKRTAVHAYIPNDLHRRVHIWAKKHDRSVAWVVKTAMELFLKKHK
jgi:predicted transcriptional regulator